MTETTDVTEATESDDAEIAAPEGAETVEAVEVVETRAADEAPAREPLLLDRPIQTVGRRKEAVVRVRLTPGTGKFTLD
ncbi:MAG: ribosomal protein, partial [Mycobacterium sp.]|nr:ribosomal protein [Mycobacterium sp.]